MKVDYVALGKDISEIERKLAEIKAIDHLDGVTAEELLESSAYRWIRCIMVEQNETKWMYSIQMGASEFDVNQRLKKGRTHRKKDQCVISSSQAL